MNFYANILEGKENKGPVIGDDYFLQTKEEINKWMSEYCNKYSINDDLTVDADYFNIENMNDRGKIIIPKIPVKFNKIKGNFNIGGNKFKTLKGCPDYVGGDFDCSYNELTTLQYCPQKVEGGFNCSHNKIKTLTYCPKNIDGGFYAESNKLTSLKGLPASNFQINVRWNPLKTLKDFYGVSAELLLDFKNYYPQLSIEEIEWDKVKDIDKIISNLHKKMEGGKSTIGQTAEEVLSKMQQLGLY